MKRISIPLLVITILNFSCSERETPGGIKYIVLKKGDGIEMPSGDFMVLDLKLTDAKDSVLLNTQDMGYPAVLPIPDQSMAKDNGEYGVFKALSKGDCVTFKIPAPIVFSKTRRTPVPKGIDPNSQITFVANVRDVWKESNVQEFQIQMMRDRLKKQKAKDSVIIANHLREKGLEALSTPTGLRYIIQKEGVGENAKPGQVAYVHYAGYLLNGELFDTSLAKIAKENNLEYSGRNEPYPVVVNTRSVIRGWDEILQRMNKGMKLTVYIPSPYAYGEQGRPPKIPPNAILVFDMEVTNIK